jgi:hypothetical protein
MTAQMYSYGMRRRDLLDLVEVLGAEFERRGMRVHVEGLRIYYLALSRGLDRRGSVKVQWDEPQLLNWLGYLRLPPCQDRFAVRPRGSSCSCRPPDAEPQVGKTIATVGAITLISWPGGYQSKCRLCSATWIELTEEA